MATRSLPLSLIPKLTFPQAARLRKTYEYERVRAEGKRKRGSLFLLNVFFTSHKSTKCGIIVSRRVGSATVRNRIKRRLRELYRHEQASLIPGAWIVIVATSQASTATLEELRTEWVSLGKRLSIFSKIS